MPMRNSKSRKNSASTQSEKEKRLAPRIEFHLDVVVRGLKGVKQVSNFSTGGVYIQNEHSSSFKRGDKIELVTRLPLEKRIMLIKAQVAHVSGKGMGVQFMDVHGPCAQAIQSNFDVFRATIPLPPP
jgi:PilZ domain